MTNFGLFIQLYIRDVARQLKEHKNLLDARQIVDEFILSHRGEVNSSFLEDLECCRNEIFSFVEKKCIK